ncbi:MAG TPA: energy transducer TonB [Polyangia bacterium]|nr:energy transducer TonB [Polyangia bacterium]
MIRRGLSSVVVLAGVVLPLQRAAADPIAADKLAEPPLAVVAGPEAEYLRALHDHIHKRWADNFLRLAAEKLPPINPLNQAGLTAEAEIVVAPDGQLISARIARGSGFAGFDDAILEVLRDSVPLPSPPPDVRSDDERLHAHWLFARDQRRCAGVTLMRTYDPVEVALPKLLRAGRRDEALKRVAMTRGAGLPAESMFNLLAADWIKAAIHEPWATVRMARLLAEKGDDEGSRWLKNAVRRPELAADAGQALVAVKVPLCPLLKAWFDSDNWSDHQVAAVALATANDPTCVPGLAKLLGNTKARPEARAAAATALGSVDTDEARKAVAAATKDDVPAVRGAAMLAQIRPGAGRKAVIAMERFLRDPAPEMRAAAAAGVVRAGGSSNLDDLYVLFKDNDARPSLAALRELDRVPSEEATKLISRLARRPQPDVQKLAAEMLLRRKAPTEGYGSFKSYLDPKSDPDLRTLALAGADEAALQAAAVDASLGLAVFRARIARGEREQAIDWFLAHGAAVAPALQGEAMAEWLLTARALPADGKTTTAAKATAAKTARR